MSVAVIKSRLTVDYRNGNSICANNKVFQRGISEQRYCLDIVQGNSKAHGGCILPERTAPSLNTNIDFSCIKYWEKYIKFFLRALRSVKWGYQTMNPRLNSQCETLKFPHVKKPQSHESAMAQFASNEENYLLQEVLGFLVHRFGEIHLIGSFFLQIQIIKC